MLDKAISLAAIFHEGQFDKSGVEYILHPLNVMFELRRNGFNDDCQIVGVLHDVVEDTECSLDYLETMGYQPNIIEAVDAITRRDNETYKEYIERCLENPIAFVVKFYDALHNLDRTTGVDENFKQFVEKRYGGTIDKILYRVNQDPQLFESLKVKL